MKDYVQIYTTAPVDYDYGYVRPIADNVAVTDRGKVVRLVAMPAESVDYQCGRYGSGLNWCGGRREYDKMVAAGYGMMVATPEARVDYYRRTFDLRPVATKPRRIGAAIRALILDDNPALVKDGGMFTYELTIRGDKARFDRICGEIEAALRADDTSLEAILYTED